MSSSWNAARDVFKQMKGQKTPQEPYDHLSAFDYLEPKYDQKLDGKDLRECSTGEAGWSSADLLSCDDQPEDNLDNGKAFTKSWSPPSSRPRSGGRSSSL
jgi:hypothetical protein